MDHYINKENITKSFCRRRIGITSVYSGGKGTVTRILESLGAYPLDFDILARDIVEPGEPALMEISKLFGIEMINTTGGLDRSRLAEVVFESPVKLKQLNIITHNRILERAEKIMHQESQKNSKRIFALNIPLLFEANLIFHVDLVVVVNTPEHICIERGKKRDGLSEEQIKKRLQYQIPINEKINQADVIIENNGSIRELEVQVIELWRMLTKEL